MKKTLATAITSALLMLSQSSMADLTTGLAAHYSFDDCTATDNSGNHNNGTITGSLQCVKGADNQALQFDGASYITVPSAATLHPAKEWTMAFWIRVDSYANQFSAIIHKGGAATTCGTNREYTVWLQNNASFLQAVAGGDNANHCQAYFSSKPFTPSTGKWLHYVGIIDRSNHVMKIYLNGKLSTLLADQFSSFNSNTADLRIGSTEEINGAFAPFKGSLDDVRFYDRSLTETEIKELYTRVKPISGSVSGLQDYTATCTNITTGKSKIIPLANGLDKWSCNSAGLKSNEGDSIEIKLNGTSW
ncbi:MAG: LamG domain-containing protein [Methylovulum sp.]|nr:LamG domain-containing protein [Methylovulum sp.]